MFEFKLIALLLMILDHGNRLLFDGEYIILNIISRISAPLFIFALVEGYLHTSNKKNI